MLAQLRLRVSFPNMAESIHARCQWKGLELNCNPLHEILIVQQGPGFLFWDLEIFHNYLRNVRAPRWLRKKGGASRIQKVTRSLYPHLNYQWIPSTQMLTALGSSILPGVAREKTSGTTVMASIPWILIYVLSTNVTRVVRKKDRWIRARAFRVLSSLVSLACSTSCASEEDRVKISFSFGEAMVDINGIVRGDEAWEAEISKHRHRCFQMLAVLGSGGSRKGAGLTDLGSGCGVATMMWHWALLTYSTSRERTNKDINKAGQCILGELLAFTANQLEKWTVQQEEASTARLVSLQRKGRRSNPAILSRLLQKGHKRAACRSWQQDGMQVKTNVEHFENKMSAVYFQGVKTLFAKESLLEVILDSSMFGTRDYQVHIVFAPRRNIAAHLPPTIVRHIRWRGEDAGLPISEAEQKTFEATGFRAKKGQSIEDSIRLLHHVLKIACTEGEGLLKFKCPVDFKPLASGEKRIWSDTKQCWLRRKGTPTSGAEEETCPELPESMLEVESISTLLATVDQKQCQWSAGQYLGHEGFMFWMREDCFHRSWRDFMWAMEVSVGGFHHTCAQLTHCFGVNYQAMGMHMAKRRELQAEWRQLLPHYGPDFEQLCAMISLDQREPCPRTEAEVQAKWDKLILEDTTYEHKGPEMRQSAWYNIVKLISINETRWHAQKYHAEKVAEQLVKSPAGKKILQDTAPIIKSMDAHRSREHDDQPAMSTYQFKAKLKKLRKEVGNSLLLAPKFYHTENCINARIMCGVGQVAYSEQAFWGKLKTTAKSDRDIMIKYSTGLGEETLRAMWWNSVGSADDLARLILNEES